MTYQSRITVPDRIGDLLRSYPALSNSDKFILFCDAIFPEWLEPSDRDTRLVALMEGRLVVNIVPKARPQGD